MTTRIEMINAALMRIGALPVVDEQDPAARQHIVIYDGLIEDFASKPFDFFKITRRLVRLGAPPDPAHYRYQYQLPADRIGTVRALYADAEKRVPVTDWDIESDVLLCDHEQVWATILRTVDPARWPGDFREVFRVTLMAEFALSVREDRPLHDRLWQKARGTPQEAGIGGLMRTALEANGQGHPSEALPDAGNPLIDARF